MEEIVLTTIYKMIFVIFVYIFKIIDVNVLFFFCIYHKNFIFVIALTVLPNIALGKPVEQSSTSSSYEAKYAVDGNRGTNFVNDKCASTKDGDTSPWWRVDLQALYSITSVSILNRGLDKYGTGMRTE